MQLELAQSVPLLSPPERTLGRELIGHSPPAGSLNVLIVEDDDAVRGACAGMATSLGCSVRTANSVAAARSLLNEAAVDLVLLDMRLPGGSGDNLMAEIRASHPRAFVVIMTAYATVNSAVELMRNGAGHFLQKPFALNQVAAVLEEAAGRRQGFEASRALQDQLQSGIAAGRLVGTSSAMQKLFRIVSKVAHTAHPVLILGEHGTGKEVFARAIHANGPNALSPFVAVDCDSLDPARLEADLFGCEQTTPEGTRSRSGLLTAAGNGTAYLAEIGALGPQAQVRLYRALQEKQIKPDGATAAVPLRARILASSTGPLERMVEEGRFRKDLYYRLNVATLRVPPLRERVEDVPLLAERFLERQRRDRNTPFVLSEEALTHLLGYVWAGNVAELECLIEHACALSSGPELTLADMPTQIKNFVQATEVAAQEEEQELEAAADMPVIPLQDMEKQAIHHALQHFKGDKILAAKYLGIGKTTLYRKLKEYGLSDDANSL